MEARYLTDLEWRICHAVNIYVFRNGRDGEQPVLVHVPPSKKKNMRTLMGVIQDRVRYPVGYAKFLFKMDGTRIRDPCELEMYNNYVVASNFEKNFKCASYGRKRSPLLVLNRESKHVRVLKLQNQNYYEWLLKKKAVGEERPPYIYPTYYTNENYRPQDLPVGQMGNYNPPEVQAPGCCYPRMDEGKKTYRVGGGKDQYVVNAVTVDVTPDLSNVIDISGKCRIPKQLKNKQNKQSGKLGGKVIVEQTPSDMVNANVLVSDGTSQEGITHTSVGSSETDEQLQSKKTFKSRRLISDPFGNEKKSMKVEQSSNYSLEDIRKQKKSGKKTKRKKDGLKSTREFGLPPPPSQFRDPADPSMKPFEYPAQTTDFQQHSNNEDILNFVDKNRNIASMAPQTQRPFYYSPEKLAGINSTTNMLPNALGSQLHHQQNSGASPWAYLRPTPQPVLPQIFALGSQHASQAATLFPASTLDRNTAHYSNVVGPYSQVQNLQIPHQTSHSLQGGPMLFHAPQGSHQATPCVVIPNPNGIPGTQLLALQSPGRQSHIQQVYQLGIVQQPDPQNCIQVDAKAMRQYVDNQKLIESRFGCGQLRQQDFQQNSKTDVSTELTESELDIPYTPLKTYRLHSMKPSMANSKMVSNDRLPKVKSRNVAIQMGFPGANSARGVNNNNSLRGAPTSEVSFIHERGRNPFRSGGRDLKSSRDMEVDGHRKGIEKYFLENKASARNSYRSFYPSISDHYLNNRSSRGAFVEKGNVSSRTARSRVSSGPMMEELVTIPPPTEFREALRFQKRHRMQSSSSKNDVIGQPYPNNFYANHNDRSNMQYINSNYQ